MDYGMHDGVLPMMVRAATAGYGLRIWGVDCSPDLSLRGDEHRLWLVGPFTLYAVKQVKKALRKALFKYKLHDDEELFEKAYSYIRQHY